VPVAGRKKGEGVGKKSYKSRRRNECAERLKTKSRGRLRKPRLSIGGGSHVLLYQEKVKRSRTGLWESVHREG